jgi:hypothetical protein
VTAVSPVLTTVRVGEIETAPAAQRWLVRALWPAAAVGILGGAPKSGKTWLGLDLALSVASGTPCLGTFAVAQPGPVLAYLAEDSLARARERVDGMARHRGLDLRALDLYLITEPVLRLDQPRDTRRLLATVELLRPRLLLLDPFVRLHRINENDAGAVSTVLAELRRLQRLHDLAVVLVHHARKNGRRPSGDALRGSSDLYAWGDTYLYLQRERDGLRLSLEHRDERPIEPVTLQLVSLPDGSGSHLELASNPTPARDRGLDELILAALAEARAPLTRTDLRARLKVNNQRLGQALSDLQHRGHLKRSAEGWALPAFRSPP